MTTPEECFKIEQPALPRRPNTLPRREDFEPSNLILFVDHDKSVAYMNPDDAERAKKAPWRPSRFFRPTDAATDAGVQIRRLLGYK